MRKTIKKWIKAIFRKWPKLKKPVTKLYRLTREDNSSNSGKSNKAMQNDVRTKAPEEYSKKREHGKKLIYGTGCCMLHPQKHAMRHNKSI